MASLALLACSLPACGGTIFFTPEALHLMANTDSVPTTVDPNTPEQVADPNLVVAPQNVWTWVPVAGMECGDGSGTGIAVYPTGSTRLTIVLQDGDRCASEAECKAAATLGGFDAARFAKISADANGLWNRQDAQNPVAQDSLVFIPNCTGDQHSGDHVADYGVHHSGFANIGHALAHIVPTFSKVSAVLLTGSGAGGAGAFYNYGRVQAAFGSVPVAMLNDSGPFFGTPDADITDAQYSAWGLAKTIDPNCEKCLPRENGLTLNIYTFYANTLLAPRSGLLCSTSDATVAAQNGLDPKGNALKNALDDLATRLKGADPGFRVYYVNGTQHGLLEGQGGSLGNLSSGGVALSTFLAQQLSYSANWKSVQ